MLLYYKRGVDFGRFQRRMVHSQDTNYFGVSCKKASHEKEKGRMRKIFFRGGILSWVALGGLLGALLVLCLWAYAVRQSATEIEVAMVTPAPAPTCVVVETAPPSVVTSTFYLREMDGKVLTMTSLEVTSSVRPYFFDESGGAIIKTQIDLGPNVLVALGRSEMWFEDVLRFPTPWTGMIDRTDGDFYSLGTGEEVWALPPNADLARVMEEAYRKEVGTLIYHPRILGEYSPQRKFLVVARNFPLQPSAVYPTLLAFQQYVNTIEHGAGFVMGPEDAKRHAYYNGQPDGEIEWRGEKLYGWVFPQAGNGCGYTHLALAYSVSTGYDTPYAVRGVVYVNVKEDEGLQHGTLLDHGEVADWDEFCAK